MAAEGIDKWWKEGIRATDRNGGTGGGGGGGQECSHDSITPSFTVSQRIKYQTNQSSTKQTSIARAMMAFTSPGCISIK